MKPQIGTYTIEPARHAGAGFWVVRIGPRWESLPLTLAHLRIYVKNARLIGHARRA